MRRRALAVLPKAGLLAISWRTYMQKVRIFAGFAAAGQLLAFVAQFGGLRLGRFRRGDRAQFGHPVQHDVAALQQPRAVLLAEVRVRGVGVLHGA
ncbi:hypothetical protein ACFSTC_13360 [Nonomuraea ferruginea]